MIEILRIAVFILSLAIASGGILIASHLRTTYKTDFFSSLLFFEVFWFTFGFYVLWGQIIVAAFLEPHVEPGLLEGITNITIFLGSPFLLFAWFMFVKLARETACIKSGNTFITLFLISNFMLVPGIGYLLVVYIGIPVMLAMKYLFVVLSVLYITVGSYSLLLRKKKQYRLNHTDRRNLVFGLLLLMILQNALYLLSGPRSYLTLTFILLFYSFGGFMPLYFRYRTDLSGLLAPEENNPSFDRFCEKFKISKREKEVIREICDGFSNQQIANKLFISLQTVKDHTHRIYGKTNCSSRAQLMWMVNEGG
jgi:DNA-binding CsgD family transcriptional regulator